jgi:hypothetical protein
MVGNWFKRRGQAIWDVFEFDFWAWLFLTNQGRAAMMSAISGIGYALHWFGVPERWEYFAGGGLVSALLIFLPGFFLNSTEEPIASNAPANPQTAALPHAVIEFNYLPASPLNNGWHIAYFDGRFKQQEHALIEADWRSNRWKIAPNCPKEGSIVFDLNDGAFDYAVTRNSALSHRIEFDANYIDDSALIFLQVLLATRDGQNTTSKFIKFIIGSRAPYPTRGYEESEYTVEIEPQTLGQGWRRVVLDLSDVVAHSWGQNGWSYKELKTIRLRGKLGISPIRLY